MKKKRKKKKSTRHSELILGALIDLIVGLILLLVDRLTS